MSLFEQVALGIQALRFTVLALFRPRLWAPWLMLGAVEVLVVVALWQFAHPAFSWFMAPLLSRLAGEPALHYPRVFELMPEFFDRADVAVGALLGSVAIGIATPLFAGQFRGETPRVGEALAQGLRRSPALILVQLPFNVLVTGISLGVSAWLAHRGGAGLITRAAELGVTGGSLALQASFFYAAALVMLKGRSALESLRELPSTWRRGFVPACVVGALTLLLLLPLHWLSGQEDLVVARGRPELVGWLTLLEVAGGLLNWFLLTGSATLIFLSALDRPDDEA